jgi:ketopantoate reductase
MVSSQSRIGIIGAGSSGVYLAILLIQQGFQVDQKFLDGTRHVIYPWNQSKIENRKSSSPRIYPWRQSKISNRKSQID